MTTSRRARNAFVTDTQATAVGSGTGLQRRRRAGSDGLNGGWRAIVTQASGSETARTFAFGRRRRRATRRRCKRSEHRLARTADAPAIRPTAALPIGASRQPKQTPAKPSSIGRRIARRPIEAMRGALRRGRGRAFASIKSSSTASPHRSADHPAAQRSTRCCPTGSIAARNTPDRRRCGPSRRY